MTGSSETETLELRDRSSSSPRVALALGGGAARGLAHIGVLEVFEREGIAFDSIVGSSMGGLNCRESFQRDPDAYLGGNPLELAGDSRRDRFPTQARGRRRSGSRSDPA